MFHVQDSMLLLSNDYQDSLFRFLKYERMELNDSKWGQMRSIIDKYLRNARRNVTLLISNRRLGQTSLDAAD